MKKDNKLNRLPSKNKGEGCGGGSVRFVFHLKTFSYQFGKYDLQGGKNAHLVCKGIYCCNLEEKKKEEEKSPHKSAHDRQNLFGEINSAGVVVYIVIIIDSIDHRLHRICFFFLVGFSRLLLTTQLKKVVF